MNWQQLHQDYERDGVIRVEGFFTPEEVAEAKREVDRYGREIAPGLEPSEVTFEADGQTPRNLWRMEHHDDFFNQMWQRPKILDAVRTLVNGDPVLMGVETFNKPSKIGSGVPPHQDNAYFCQQPPDVLTVWIAMDPATHENGPVYYIPGTHKQGMPPHKPSGVKGNSFGLAESFDTKNPFIGTLNPGDALIHHCQVIHYSKPNESDKPRCGLLMVFRGAHTETDPKLKAAYDEARALV